MTDVEWARDGWPLVSPARWKGGDLVWRALREGPAKNAELLARVQALYRYHLPYNLPQLTARQVAAHCVAMRRQGLVERDPDGTWRFTRTAKR